ncbi:uncharacterized protein LOC119617037 [Kryptolebias marmoratus]|uniref:uncharacterized protein LOC119617037 n=1 Tax=Kryptolebias marmoratus TaxID=37003 RepID=UPI0018ACEFB8|nr:uncharacterized protein LOC119617037 [Kryptolebias marmoratus]
MGNSMGCVRPSREGEQDGSPPLPPKKRSRFRFKHKGIKSRRAEVEEPDGERGRGQDPEDEDPNAAVPESSRTSVPDFLLTYPHSNTLSPGAMSVGAGGLLSSSRLEGTPKPSPAWRGVFCLPGEEDTVSAIIDVSSIPSQTTATTPVSTTPGGGRVCRVREKAQGVLEKPWIFRQRRDKKDKGGAAQEVDEPPEMERRGVVHIREVDGKLCMVRTVYPNDYGSPVWRGEGHDEVEVHKDPPAQSPVIVQLLDDRSRMLQIEDPMRGFRLDSSGNPSLLESGYSSDLPLTSPETAGTTPSQTDWGGLTSSSSEKLDSMMESPLLPRQQGAVKHLPQVCL